jgi:hypothetical protein
MTKIVEHIVGCLGAEVEGNPTQFVLERLSEQNKVDVRFFTAAVASDRMQVAIDGMRAMNFDGIVFLENVAIENVKSFETFSRSALLAKSANVAKRDYSSWIVENTDGAAIVDAISLQTCSGQVAIYDSESLAASLSLARADLAHRVVLIETDDDPSAKVDEGSAFQRLNRQALTHYEQTFDALILDRPLSSLDVGLLRSAIGVNTKVLDTSMDETPTKQSHLVDVKWIDFETYQCHKLAATFEFLTGTKADIKNVRELLDEYSSW